MDLQTARAGPHTGTINKMHWYTLPFPNLPIASFPEQSERLPFGIGEVVFDQLDCYCWFGGFCFCFLNFHILTFPLNVIHIHVLKIWKISQLNLVFFKRKQIYFQRYWKVLELLVKFWQVLKFKLYVYKAISSITYGEVWSYWKSLSQL